MPEDIKFSYDSYMNTFSLSNICSLLEYKGMFKK